MTEVAYLLQGILNQLVNLNATTKQMATSVYTTETLDQAQGMTQIRPGDLVYISSEQTWYGKNATGFIALATFETS